MFDNIFYKGTITTLSPLSHNSDESFGTDTKFRRMKISIKDEEGKKKFTEIPIYSGNAFRGILRRIAAKQFCDVLGIEGISEKLYYTFFVGGSLQKGSTQDYIDVGGTRELRKNIPFLSLFGTALGNKVVSGKMQIGVAVPIAKETELLTGERSDLSIWGFTDEIFYTRRDDLEDKKEEKDVKKQAQQMKYNVEVLSPGVRLHHTINLEGVTGIEKSCAGYFLSALKDRGILGGKSGVGHGKVLMEYEPSFCSGEEYLKFLNDNRDSLLDYVENLEKAL